MQNYTRHHKKFYALNQPIEFFFGIDDRYDATIYWKSKDGSFLGCNHFQATLLGIDQTEFLGRNDGNFFPHKVANHIRRNDLIVTANQSAYAFIETAKLKSNHLLSFLSFKTPLKDSANHSLGIFGVSFILKEGLKLDLDFAKPFLSDHGAYNLAHAYPALVMLLENNITRREAEVLYYFIRCRTVKDIMTHIQNISARITVDFHLNNCKKKLGVHTLNEMTALLWDKNFAFLTLENMYSLFL